MNHQIADAITGAASEAALRIVNQAEAAALRLEARAKSKDEVKASVRRALANIADIVCTLLDEDASEDNRLAASIRAGEGIIPPAPQLADPVVNAAAVVDPPMVPRLLPDEMPPTLRAVEPVETARTDPQPENLAA